MTRLADLHAEVLAALRAITTVTSYDGDVPTSPPSQPDGRVLPYAVLWPAAGGSPQERPLGGCTGLLTWSPRVTVAAGEVGWCLDAISLVRATLADRYLAAASGYLREITPASRSLMRDVDTDPVRWYLPLEFEIGY